MKHKATRRLGWLISILLIILLSTCLVFAQTKTDDSTVKTPQSLIVLTADLNSTDVLLKGVKDNAIQADFKITVKYGSQTIEKEITQFQYDKENQIAHITFASIACDPDYTGNVSVTVQYKELTANYVFPANHANQVEQEVKIESIKAGSVERPAHDPDYCTPDKLIDGSYLTPNDFTGKHGNHIYGFGMWMTSPNPGKNAWVEAMFDRE